MGATESYRVEYLLGLQNLQRQLLQGEEMIRSSGQRISTIFSPISYSEQAGDIDQVNKAKALQLRQMEVERRQSADLKGSYADQTRRTHELNRAKEAQQRLSMQQTKLNRQEGASAKTAAGEFRTLGLAFRRMILWWSTAAVLLGTQKLVRNIMDVAGTFQTTVRDLTVIGSEGEEAYRKLAVSAYDAAIATGRSFDEAADAMRNWVRQGYSAVEIAELTRTTLVGLNLTKMGSVELTRTLTAVMRAYNIPAEDSMQILDRLIGVSRKYAIETNQLATGIRRFARSAALGNVTLNQQMGIMTAMMVSTQQSAQMVGRAGRTIFTRLRRNAVEALETIAKIKVFTDDTRETYRSTWEILTDLAVAWGTLTEAQREEVAFQAAGMRQREFFIALMEDFTVAQEANIEAMASAGLAYRSNIMLVDTLQRSIEQLRTSWEKLLASQAGMVGFFTNVVRGLRQILDISLMIPESFAAIGAALAALGGAALTGAHPVIGGLVFLGGLASSISYILGSMRLPNVRDLIQEYKDLADAQLATVKSTEDLAREYISLYEQHQKGVDQTKLLEKARDALNDITPALLSGEQGLAEVYDILTGRLDELTEATKKATEARRAAQIQIQRQALFEARTELSEARQRLPLDIRIKSEAALQRETNRVTDEYIQKLERVAALERDRVSISKMIEHVPEGIIAPADVDALEFSVTSLDKMEKLTGDIVRLQQIRASISAEKTILDEHKAFLLSKGVTQAVLDDEQNMGRALDVVRDLLTDMNAEWRNMTELVPKMPLAEGPSDASLNAIRQQLSLVSDLAAKTRGVLELDALRSDILGRDLPVALSEAERSMLALYGIEVSSLKTTAERQLLVDRIASAVFDTTESLRKQAQLAYVEMPGVISATDLQVLEGMEDAYDRMYTTQSRIVALRELSARVRTKEKLDEEDKALFEQLGLQRLLETVGQNRYNLQVALNALIASANEELLKQRVPLIEMEFAMRERQEALKGEVKSTEELASNLNIVASKQASIKVAEQNMLDLMKKKVPEIKDEKDEQEEINLKLKDRLKIMQLQEARRFYEREGIKEGLEAAEQEIRLKQHLFNISSDYLKAIIDGTTREALATEDIADAREMLASYQEEGLEFEQHWLDIVKSSIELTNRRTEFERQLQDERLDWIRELQDMEIQSTSKMIEASQGRIAARKYELEAARDFYQEIRQEFEALPTDITVEFKAEKEKDVLSALKRVAQAEIALEEAVGEADRQLREEQLRLQQLIAKEAAEKSESDIGAIAAAQKLVDEAQAYYEKLDEGSDSLDDQVEVMKALQEVYKARIRLAREETRQEKAIEKLREQQRELAIDQAAEMTRIAKGEMAALEEIISERESDYETALALGDELEHQVKQHEALLELLKAYGDLDAYIAAQQKERREEDYELGKRLIEMEMDAEADLIRRRHGDVTAAAFMYWQRQEAVREAEKELAIIKERERAEKDLYEAKAEVVPAEKELSLQQDRELGEKRIRDAQEQAIVAGKEYGIVRKSVDEDIRDVEKEIREEQQKQHIQETEYLHGRRAAKEAEILLLADEISSLADIAENEDDILEIREKELQLEKEKTALKQIDNELTRAQSDMYKEIVGHIANMGAGLLKGAAAGELFATGLYDILTTALAAQGPIAVEIAGYLTAAKPLFSAIFDKLFGDPADKMSDSMDTNTMALDRNTQAIDEMSERIFGAVPTEWVFPAAIARLGEIPMLQGGGYIEKAGLAYLHPRETVLSAGSSTQQTYYYTMQSSPVINVYAQKGQSAEDIANAVDKKLKRNYRNESERAFTPNIYNLE